MCCAEYQPGDTGGDDWHHQIEHQPLHEQVPQAWPVSYNGHIEVNSALLDAVLRDKPELTKDE
jgi:hypothetical protein